MWKCLKCGREFKHTDQHHYCGNIETIDQYIADQREEVRPILRRIRETIRSAAPNAQERISWRMPTFWQDENLIHFAAFTRHIGIYPGDLSLLPFRARIETYRTTKGAIQFPLDQVDYDLIAEITQHRVSAARRKEVPSSRKGPPQKQPAEG